MGHMPALGNPDHRLRYKELSLTLHRGTTRPPRLKITPAKPAFHWRNGWGASIISMV